MVSIGPKLAIEVRYHRQGGGFQQALIHSIETPTTSESNSEKVLKKSLAVERKVPFESKKKIVEIIKDAIVSMDPVIKRYNVNQFMRINPKQAIITINGVDQERLKILIDKVSILVKKCPLLGQDVSLTIV